MANQTFISENEQNRIRREDLQRAVLLHLTERGSAKWGALYSHFDEDGTGAIGEALQLLAEWRYIALEGDGTAKITTSGTQQLKAASHQYIIIPRVMSNI